MFDPRPLVDRHAEGLRSLARALDIDPAVLCRPLSVWQADRYSVRMGLHPWEVYGDTWFAPLWAADEVTPSALAA